MQRNWLRYLHIAAKSWTAWNNVKHHTSYIIHLLSHHTSSIKHQTSSDCTGGRIGDAVRYCQSEQINENISQDMDKKYQVFVSSTYEDLQEERKAVMEALLQMNCFHVGMEYFNASDESQWDVIKQLIDECDYYVLIVAGRYGSVEESTGKSYTQKEFEYAVSKNVPVISFLHQDPDSLPKSKTETDKTKEAALEVFREDVKKRLCKFWTSSDNLASQVVLSLHGLIKSKPRVGWVKADQLNA